MREIEFRGKKGSTKEWVEGSLIVNKAGNHVITQVIENPVHLGTLNGWCFAVMHETIGQYTGLKDKNGTKIFEGDVVRSKELIMIVDYSIKYASFCIKNKNWSFIHYFGEAVDSEKCEVLGNIHDNPELLNID